MRREPAGRRYLRFWGVSPEDDVDDEFRFHLETKIQELQTGGLTRDQARREALRQFGPLDAARAECIAITNQRERRMTWTDSLQSWFADLRYAVRVLGKTKASTAAAILILAVGIGATTAVFTVLDRVIYRPLPVPSAGELALVSHWTAGKNGVHIGVTFNDEGYRYLRDHNAVLTDLAVEAGVIGREQHAHERIEQPAKARLVSENFFDVLEVRPWAGRPLGTGGDRHVAVAGYRFANRRYESPADAIGKTVYLNNIPFLIVGVMPPGFYGTEKGSDPDLYAPIETGRELVPGLDWNHNWALRAIGRLRRGVDFARAQSELQGLWSQFLAMGTTQLEKDDRIACESGARGYAGTQGERQVSL
jgi:putative ABC transport system permease protein